MSSYEYFRNADRLSAAAAASFCLAADTAVYGGGGSAGGARCGSAVAALTSAGSTGNPADLYYGAVNGTSGRASAAYLQPQQQSSNFQTSVDFKGRGLADMAAFRGAGAAGFPDYSRPYSDGYGTPIQQQAISTAAGVRCSPPSPSCLKPIGATGGNGLRQADEGSSGALSPPLSDSSSVDGDSSMGSGGDDVYGADDHSHQLQVSRI